MPGHGAIWWNELNTHDPEKAKAFYGAVFGWEFSGRENPGGNTYWTGTRLGVPVAGIFNLAGVVGKEVRDHWLTYIEVADVDAAAAAAVKAGGMVIRAPFDIPGGRIAIITDSNGAYMGIGKPGSQM